MRRLREHDVRPVTDLRGVWDFAFLGDCDPQALDPKGIEFTDRMAVPGCFDATLTYAGKRGLAAYRRRVLVRAAGRHRLIFDGAHHWCRVLVDGQPIRDHVGGFTRFAADLLDLPAGEVEVVVLVDNRFDSARCPLHLDYFDWYQYGGISRGVELHCLDRSWIEGVEVETADLGRRTLRVTISYGADEVVSKAPLRGTIDGEVVLGQSVSLEPPGGEIAWTLELPAAALWSPEEPNLHLLHVTLGGDDWRERVGIRQVRVEGRQILLNDRPLRLLGVNRHESHPQFGHGLPDQLLVTDAQLLRDLSCNYVRGAHYPQDARWLDLCDEMGFLVWSEVIGWQHTAEHLTDERFMQAQLVNLEEMVAGARNHPSVILYGILNESCAHDPTGRPGYTRLLARLRELDPTRLITYTSTRPEKDLCYDLVDVISVDTYPGWYEGSIEDIPHLLDAVVETLRARGFGDKPLLMGEIGAGGIWGWRDWHADRWSEQYQAQVLDRALPHLLSAHSPWCGVGVWQLSDMRAAEKLARALMRPRGFNNKGLVDEYRRPKLAYEVVKRHFTAHRGRA